MDKKKDEELDDIYKSRESKLSNFIRNRMTKAVLIIGGINIVFIVFIIILQLIISPGPFRPQINYDAYEKVQTVRTNEVDISKWDTSKVDIVYDTEGVPVPVPKGYTVSNVVGEHTVRTGFVIYEGEEQVVPDLWEDNPIKDKNELIDNIVAWKASKERNQWVWIEVPNPSRIYEIDRRGTIKSTMYYYSALGRRQAMTYSSTGSSIISQIEPELLVFRDNADVFKKNGLKISTKEEFLEEMQKIFEDTIKSIEKYGGFYIGRYETGDLNKEEFVIKRMNDDTEGQITWYEIYKKMKFLAKDTNIKTNMMWGNLWDETLQWLIDTGAEDIEGKKLSYETIGEDSTSWGNYENSTFNYTNSTDYGVSTKKVGIDNRIMTRSYGIYKG